MKQNLDRLRYPCDNPADEKALSRSVTINFDQYEDPPGAVPWGVSRSGAPDVASPKGDTFKGYTFKRKKDTVRAALHSDLFTYRESIGESPLNSVEFSVSGSPMLHDIRGTILGRSSGSSVKSSGSMTTGPGNRSRTSSSNLFSSEQIKTTSGGKSDLQDNSPAVELNYPLHNQSQLQLTLQQHSSGSNMK
jgi:hypothetical protein